MKHLLTIVWIILRFRDTTEYFSTVECPQYSTTDISQFNEFDDSSTLDCTLLMSCKDPFEIYSKYSHDVLDCPDENKFYDYDSLFECFTNDDHTCSMRLKVTMIRDSSLESTTENPCENFQNTLGSSLLPVPGNCSLFYKCDWGSAILFECPSELHFNAELQVCDWPWQAQCLLSRNICPRPYPRCPVNYPRPLYLPHPRLCDKFYQCDWGISYLQACPTGLHFNSELKICDWPYRANCQVC